MTFNIHHGVGTDARLDLGRIAAVIRSVQPDVVGLQEVDRRYGGRSARADQASWLARALRMSARFGPALHDGVREYGNAVLSARPIRSWDWSPLPTPSSPESRCVLRCRLDGDVEVWVTHLSNDSANDRVEQARTLAGRLRTSTAPTVLVGDFNATPDDPSHAELAETLTDAWATLRPADPGPTFSTTNPRLRIDYVLATATITPVRVEVVDVGVASDHHAVVADLELPGQ